MQNAKFKKQKYYSKSFFNHNDTTIYTMYTKNIFIVTIVFTLCSLWLFFLPLFPCFKIIYCAMKRQVNTVEIRIEAWIVKDISSNICFQHDFYS